tara:strand:- start:356 stop:592 length:237 start_codon:yes stop_codon:yes gene_type:complete
MPNAIIPPIVAVATSGIPKMTATPANKAKLNIARKIWGLNLPNGIPFPLPFIQILKQLYYKFASCDIISDNNLHIIEI